MPASSASVFAQIQVRVVLEAVVRHVAHEHRRLGGDQEQRLHDDLLVLREIQAAHRLGLVERGAAAFEDGAELDGLLVAGTAELVGAVDLLFHAGQVGQAQLGLDHLDVGDRVDLVVHVDDVVVVEAAHHVDDGVGLADVRQELVAQAFALGRAGHQARDVHKFDDGRHDLLRRDDVRQHLQAGVGQLDDAHVGLDRAERVVLGSDAGLGEGIEEGGLADVGQADDAAFQAHGAFFLCRGPRAGGGDEPGILKVLFRCAGSMCLQPASRLGDAPYANKGLKGALEWKAMTALDSKPDGAR